MTNDEYTSAVDLGDFPSVSSVPLDPPFVNESGSIQNLVLKAMTSVAVLESVKGAVRANHLHRTDWHYTYVVTGSVAYFERAVGSSEIPEPRLFRSGEMFFTPPMREHAMVFLEHTHIVTMAKNVRSHENHEADLERVPFITLGMAAAIVESMGR